jgi:hypothetical protein
VGEYQQSLTEILIKESWSSKYHFLSIRIIHQRDWKPRSTRLVTKMSTTTATQTIVQGGGMEARTVKEPTGAISFKAVPVIDLSPMDGKVPPNWRSSYRKSMMPALRLGSFM